VIESNGMFSLQDKNVLKSHYQNDLFSHKSTKTTNVPRINNRARWGWSTRAL